MSSFQPWRDIYARSGTRASPALAERNDRQDAAALSAIDVWGNYDDAMKWMYRPTGVFGGWGTPHEKAGESDNGLAIVRALIAETAPTVIPIPPPPQPPGGRRRVFTPRRT